MKPAIFRKIDELLDPLTSEQIERIRSAFRKAHRRTDTDALLADWIRIAETAHQHALKTSIQTEAILLIPSVRKRRDRQLRQATAALDRSIDALKRATGFLERHSFGIEYEELHQWEQSIEASLRIVRGTAESYRINARAWRTPNKSGNTLRWIPERCLGQVLSSYFRHRRWPVSTVRTGLFTTVLSAVLSRQAMNDKTLQGLAAFSTNYQSLEAEAPRGVKPARPLPVPRRRPQKRGATRNPQQAT